MRLITTVFAILVLSPAWAAVPESLSYQGYLTDRDGSPASGTTLIMFSIYNVEVGGSSLWTDTLGIDVVNGLFSVHLGRAVNQFPVNLFETPLWLGITVESDNEMIPRRALTSVGFSFRAQDADSVQGKTAADLDQSGHVDDLANPHDLTAAQVGAVDESILNAHTGDLNNPHLTTAAQTGAADGAIFASHAVDPSSHHLRYSDVDAVAAMGPTAATNPLHHDRYTDSEAFDAVLASDGPASLLDADTLDGIGGDELYVRSELYTRGEVDALLASAQGDRFTSVATEAAFGCSIRSDGVTNCWGYSDYPSLFNPPAVPLVHMSASFNFVCGIAEADNSVVCWGENVLGQLDAPAGEFEQLDTGQWFACGLRNDQTLACWGDNRDGQASPPPGAFLFVATGDSHACAVKTDNTVICWGENGGGQASPPTGLFVELSAGSAHSCGRKVDGSVTCWGSNTYGAAEDPSGEFTMVASGNDFNCGILADTTVKCWGVNGYGQSNPPFGNSFTQINCGVHSACGVRIDGSVICWGTDIAGNWTPHP